MVHVMEVTSPPSRPVRTVRSSSDGVTGAFRPRTVPFSPGRLLILVILVMLAGVGGTVTECYAQGEIRVGRIEDPKLNKTYRTYIAQDSIVKIVEGESLDGPRQVIMHPSTFRLLNMSVEEVQSDSLINNVAQEFAIKDGQIMFGLSRTVSIATLAAVGLVFLVLVGVIGVLLHRLRREQNAQEIKAVSLRHLHEGQETERLRLARDLHDGPVQDLHAIRMQIDMMTSTAPLADSILTGIQSENGHTAEGAPGIAKWQKESLQFIEQMRKSSRATQKQILDVISELRTISENLRPPALAPFGLSTAIRGLIDPLEERHPDVTFNVDLDDSDARLPEQVRLVLFRITQEAVNNALQHAEADQIDVTSRIDNENIFLEITDDGSGFDIPDDYLSLGQSGHYGVLGMSERAQMIGTNIRITSTKGEGTSVKVRAALSQDIWEASPTSVAI